MKPMKVATVVAIAGTVLSLAAPALALPGGSISGTVTSDTGGPAADVCVNAYGQTRPGYFNSFYSATTDAAGAYVIHEVFPGAYKIGFQDCSDQPRFFDEWFDDKPDYRSADLVSVAAGAETAHIDAVLGTPGTLTGTLTTETEGGEPAAGACVTVLDTHFRWLGWAVSGDDGRYVVGGLRTADVKIEFGSLCAIEIQFVAARASAPRASTADPASYGYVKEWYREKATFDDADVVHVTTGHETAGIDGVLTPAGAIGGTVTDAGGNGLSSICIEALTAGGSWAAQAYTDAGTYVLSGLAPGEYRIQFVDCGDGSYEGEWFDDEPSFAKADPVSVASGVLTDGIDAVLALRPRPDLAVTNVKIENVPITTDAGTLPVGTGWTRRVHVSIANLGDVSTDEYASVRAWTTSDTDGSSRVVGFANFSLRPGGKRDETIDWNGFGSVGDLTVHVAACTSDDRDRSNDEATLRHYTVVGGTGFGFDPFGSPYRPYGCYEGPIVDRAQ